MSSGKIASGVLRHRVFVYGTLRRGASNHFRMAGAEFVAPARVRGRLYRIDWYPGLVLDPAAKLVRGEIYDVSDDQFAALDAYEGGEYRRVATEAIASRPADETFHVTLWEWKGEVDEGKFIANGDWLRVERGFVPPVFLGLGWLLIVLDVIGLSLASFSVAGLQRMFGAQWANVIFALPFCALLHGWAAMRRGESARRWIRRLILAALVLVGVTVCVVR